MNRIQYTLELLSDTVPASGTSASAIVDTEIVLDDLGLPLIPGKRLKGLLRESLMEIGEMIGTDLTRQLNSLLGEVGQAMSSSIMVSDAVLAEDPSLTVWLKWANVEYPGYFRAKSVADTFTSIRRQTKLEKGVAVNHSLRSMRVLKKGLKFKGSISSDRVISEPDQALLALAIGNIRFLGLNRNRGFGKVKCQAMDDQGKPIDHSAAYKNLVEGVRK